MLRPAPLARGWGGWFLAATAAEENFENQRLVLKGFHLQTALLRVFFHPQGQKLFKILNLARILRVKVIGNTDSHGYFKGKNDGNIEFDTHFKGKNNGEHSFMCLF